MKFRSQEEGNLPKLMANPNQSGMSIFSSLSNFHVDVGFGANQMIP
jgi:hypothetical protein